MSLLLLVRRKKTEREKKVLASSGSPVEVKKAAADSCNRCWEDLQEEFVQLSSNTAVATFMSYKKFNK